ncbi:hypothetical protein RFI_10998 [Reticulomyxa filosa]|uniref:Protein kinase domain-containing protein n=1 Tax=Reticulomyxa filosa TaxID=46433 RepID=X6NK79_RETFI|nr:hypothetical protein RFI_10998 [Reticulomyxa filosa]|eukprot:ETO26139.1 hypothetical protein RFI_10998 [Reticulomyxa filosa]
MQERNVSFRKKWFNFASPKGLSFPDEISLCTRNILKEKSESEKNTCDELRKKEADDRIIKKKKHVINAYINVRSDTDLVWKRRFFVLKDNHLLCGETELSKKLEMVYLLEGSNVSKTIQSTDMTFQLFIKKKKLFLRAPSPQQCIQWTEAIEKASNLSIKDLYKFFLHTKTTTNIFPCPLGSIICMFLRTLGVSETQNNKVVEARHRVSNQRCAIKIVDKRLCDKKSLRTEIQILKKLENPYIVQLYNLFENRKYLYVVMELLSKTYAYTYIT